MIIFKGKKEKWSQLITKCISLCAKSVQWCPTVCGPMDCSPLGSSVHGILQARLLEWVAMPSSRGSSWPRDQTWVSHIAGRFFTVWATKVPSTYGLEGHKRSGHGKMVQNFKCTQEFTKEWALPDLHPSRSVPLPGSFRIIPRRVRYLFLPNSLYLWQHSLPTDINPASRLKKIFQISSHTDTQLSQFFFFLWL